MAMSRAEQRRQNFLANERIAKAKAEAQQHVHRGTCPQCGLPLKRNLALAGWWQCVAFGEPSFRPAGFAAAAKCSFQCFTE